jgi:transmembrane sensor
MSSHPRTSQSTLAAALVEASAAAWLSLRDRGMNATETAEFVRWLQQDPQHATVFAELDRVWKDFDRLDSVPVSAAAPDADLLAPRVRRQQPRVLVWSALAAAAIVLLAAFQYRAPGIFVETAVGRAPGIFVETAVGAFQQLELPDGSVVQLNTDTAIETAYSATERRVRVLRGEAFFAVSKDPARPFIVASGPVVVRAVGTAFNVRQHTTSVEVMVTEGRVRIDHAGESRSLLPVSAATGAKEHPLLVAGEKAVVPVTPLGVVTAVVPIATVEKIAASAVERALAWQERRLEFDAVSLAEVVREFNRYNRRQLVIADPRIAAKHFSGTFRSDGYESFVRLLETHFSMTAIRSEREIMLQLRH